MKKANSTNGCGSEKNQPSAGGAPSKSTLKQASVPRLAGEWRRLITPPRLEQYDKDGIEAVDFTIYQAADGTWQLISCLRNTTFPGGGRLLYRWETKHLSGTDWTPRGIFWTTKSELNQKEGVLQAPYCVREGGQYYLFHNSNGAFCLISEDGKNFRQHKAADGQARFFDMGRDVQIFDNRTRDGRWYAFFTDVIEGKYAERKGHTVSFRTARDLNGPWSVKKTDTGVVTPDRPGDPCNFIRAESPFVIYRNGWYYRLEQMNVLASRHVTDWRVPILTSLTACDPSSFWGYWGYMAPEVVEHEGRHYVAAYRYHEQERGIFMAEMTWGD